MSEPQKIETNVTAAPMPSADYIKLRFDQQDENVKNVTQGLKDVNDKLDKLLATFITRSEITSLKASNDKRYEKLANTVGNLKSTNERQQGAIESTRRLITIGLSLLSIITAAVAVYAGLHR